MCFWWKCLGKKKEKEGPAEELAAGPGGGVCTPEAGSFCTREERVEGKKDHRFFFRGFSISTLFAEGARFSEASGSLLKLQRSFLRFAQESWHSLLYQSASTDLFKFKRSERRRRTEKKKNKTAGGQ